MKSNNGNNLFIVAISSLMLAFFIVLIILRVVEHVDVPLSHAFMAQLIAFSVAAFASIVYFIRPLLADAVQPGSNIQKLVRLSDSNTPVDECSLVNRTSVLLCKADDVYFSFHEGRYPADEYAVLNLVHRTWYVERVSEIQSVGIKRAGEQYVYRLKVNTSYKLGRNDTIYLDSERILTA